MKKQPTKKKAERMGKPAGGYIGQAMEAARANRAKPINRNALVTTIRHIVREELGLIEQIKAEKFTRAEIVQSEPTEGEVERAVNIFFAADADSNKSMRRVLEWWNNRLFHLRSKP